MKENTSLCSRSC